MMLNMVETSQEYFDMLQYGIEGETYVLGENGEANYPDGMNAANSNYMDWGGRWAFWKPQFMRPNFEYPEGRPQAAEPAMRELLGRESFVVQNGIVTADAKIGPAVETAGLDASL